MACVAGAQSQKNYKDPAEYDMYNAASQDITAGNFSKAIADLDAWKRKYPDSEFVDTRELFYVKSYFETKQPSKALEAAAGLLAKDYKSTLDGPTDVINLLYMAAAAIQQVQNPAPGELAAGAKAARELATYDYEKVPNGVTAEDWAKARIQMQGVSKAALLYIALVPGAQALKKKDCPVAESALKRALEDYPYSAQAAAYLAEAELCLYKNEPDKISIVLYELARAASIDPVQSMVDPKWQAQSIEPRLEDIYRQYHGADPNGLKQLKELAVSAPLPPPGFAIKSTAVIAQEKQAEFEKNNPELALWINVKAALAGANGEQYFISDLKDSAVPKLLGVLVEARPACRPTELLVAVSAPDSAQALQPEIALKLDKPLAGKPDPDSEFRWEGVPVAFTAKPFLLTMTTEADKIDGLKTSPCAPAAVKTDVKKGPPKGKQ
jgi:hypothetical protein